LLFREWSEAYFPKRNKVHKHNYLFVCCFGNGAKRISRNVIFIFIFIFVVIFVVVSGMERSVFPET